MSSQDMSTLSNEAVQHLKRLKPTDGWSTETYITASGRRLVMLRRRNIPLSDAGFSSIVHDEGGSGCVVGLLPGSTNEMDSSGSQRKGVVLVEQDGSVAKSRREIVVQLSSKSSSSSSSSGLFGGGCSVESAATAVNKALEKQRADREVRRRALNEGSNTPQRQTTRNNTAQQTTTTLTDEQNKQLLQYAFYTILTAAFLKLLSSSFLTLSILLLLPTYLYATQTRPPPSSFDAKQQIKRVLRGAHLPDSHPEKPKSWLEQTVAKVQASVTTEAATALGGYEVTLTDLGGVGYWAQARVPASKVDLYWVGVFGEWRYVTMKSIPDHELR